jgi:four helix bundle protein
MAIKSYRDLIAWQKAMELAEAVYRETRGFPKEETYGLRAQLRRAAVSIPSNVAEGQGRHSDGAFSRHLSIAHGSLCELETQLLLAGRLAYITQTRLDGLMSAASEVGRLVIGLDQAVTAV